MPTNVRTRVSFLTGPPACHVTWIWGQLGKPTSTSPKSISCCGGSRSSQAARSTVCGQRSGNESCPFVVRAAANRSRCSTRSFSRRPTPTRSGKRSARSASSSKSQCTARPGSRFGTCVSPTSTSRTTRTGGCGTSRVPVPTSAAYKPASTCVPLDSSCLWCGSRSTCPTLEGLGRPDKQALPLTRGTSIDL